MEMMTDKQVRFLTWLTTTATDKCTTIDEVSDGLIDLTEKNTSEEK